MPAVDIDKPMKEAEAREISHLLDQLDSVVDDINKQVEYLFQTFQPVICEATTNQVDLPVAPSRMSPIGNKLQSLDDRLHAALRSMTDLRERSQI